MEQRAMNEAGSAARILVVDDSEDNRLLLQTILSKVGYSVYLAESAQDAYAFMGLEGSVGPAVDLILLDIIMPDIDGIAACHRFKEHAATGGVPIIMVTAKTDDEALQRSFAAGAVDYITKPINKVELLARVRSILRLKHEMDQRRAREQELLEANRQLAVANQMLERLAALDGLTGIANRRYFDEYLDKEWQRCRRHARPLAVIMCDIDFFKKYNDNYGHQGGDECLKQVAQALQKVMKRPSDLLARYGGEEFVAVLPETEIAGAERLAEEMRACIADILIPHALSEVSDRVSLSLGVAVCVPTNDLQFKELVERADKALYQAKEQGRNRVVAFRD